MRWSLLFAIAVLSSGCLSGGHSGGSEELKPAPSSTFSHEEGTDGYFLAEDGQDIRWNFEGNGRDTTLILATLAFNDPANVTWGLLEAEDGIGRVPALVAFFAARESASACGSFEPLLQNGLGVADRDKPVQVPPGVYHFVIATNANDGGGQLKIGTGGTEVSGPRESPFLRGMVADTLQISLEGDHVGSLTDDRQEGTWFAWASFEVGPDRPGVDVPGTDGGHSIEVAANEACLRDSLEETAPVTMESQSVRIRGTGLGPIEVSAEYHPTAGPVGMHSWFFAAIVREV